MAQKTFNGKACYNPSGKAGEYSYWACNFYNGCSGNCSYCYCKKGIIAGVLGGDKPTLKKCFKSEEHAFDIFAKELKKNENEIRQHGLFFSFTSDPFLKETHELNYSAINFCQLVNIPVKVLTKQTWWIDHYLDRIGSLPDNVAYGFTLTGHNELEKGCATNEERIKAMLKLHDRGLRTWASIEPIIDFTSSIDMITKTVGYCELYKIGLESGKKYDKNELCKFMFTVQLILKDSKIYFKDSLLKLAGIKRDELPMNCVSRDYNMFKPVNDLPINFTKQEDMGIKIKNTLIKKI